MSKILAKNMSSPSPVRDCVPSSDRREVVVEMLSVTTGNGRISPMKFGQLQIRIEDVKTEVIGDETPVHHRLDVSVEPRVLPFVLSFKHITYNVKVRQKVTVQSLLFRQPAVTNLCESNLKTILDDISGEAHDGEIMAVMGTSGSGKSTLIDALANRMAKGSLKGDITLNGKQLESRLLKVISAYVMQDDLLFPMLTVEETLMFAAEFHLPRTLSRSKKKLRVKALIDQLGLRNAAKTVIGDEGHRGISGGERRRVSIGIDIIHDPILLFLDEPTSGLDSTNAFMVVKVLQRIAQSGSIVIMSIHQPSYRILGLLDQIIFLSHGQTVYSGPPSSLPMFFSNFGHPIPDNENRIEFTLDLIHELEDSPGRTKPLVEFNKSWQMLKTENKHNNTQEYSDNQSPSNDVVRLSLKEAISSSISRGKLVSGATVAVGNPASLVPTFANPAWVEMAVLSKRSFTNSSRIPEVFGVRLGATIVTGFILATVFCRLDNSPRGLQERLGFFAFTMSTIFYICADALPAFLQERYIFLRETAHNTYRRSSYVLARSLVALPSLFCLSLAFAAITFWAVGLDGSFFFYFLVIFASFWAGSSFVTFLSAVIPHEMLGYAIVVSILAYFLLFCGFFINRERIPPYWIWFHYISLVKYPYQAVLQNEFSDPVKCFVRGVQIFDNTPLEAAPEALKVKLLDSASASGLLERNITSATCVTRGADILQQGGVTDLSKWSCLWVTVAWGFLFRILFYLSLLAGSKNKRR